MFQYPWLNTIYYKILRSYYVNRGHHALILYSNQDYGEEVLIYNIAQWLVCTNPCDMKYCNICDNCCLMRTGCHPDYYQLDINYNDNVQCISIDMVRNCIDALHKSSQCSLKKVVFIKNIKYLTNQAINVLLKTIEEPPKNTYFFLKTRNYRNIPITLLSRCTTWIMHPPTELQGLTWLMEKQKKIDILSAQTALRLSCGSPIEADAMFRLSYWKYRIRLCKIIENVIISRDFLELLPLLSNVQEYDSKPVFWLISILMDALKWKRKIQEKLLVNLDQLHLISNIAVQWNILSLNNQLNQWLILFRYFQKFNNINHELILIYRLLNWRLGIVETYL